MKTIWISIALLMTPYAAGANEFMRLFKNSKPVVAAIMVESLKRDSYPQAEQWLLDQARIAKNGKMDGMLIEYRGGGILDRDIPQWEMEMMSALTRKVISSYPELVVGVEILWHFPGATLKLAKASGAKFVRVDFFSDDVEADISKDKTEPNFVTVPLDPEGLIKYRKDLQAEHIALLTDIQVKYSKMLNSKIAIDQSAKNAQKLGSDGVIVSGAQSGSSPDLKRLGKARKGVRSIPLIVGSGFSSSNAPEILPLVDAVIVGTSISAKTGGPLLPEKVSELMSFVNEYRVNKSYKKHL